MFKNYIIVAFRNIGKNKSHVLINSFGLGIAMACCIAAYMFISYNIEFNDFHKDDKVAKIYKVQADVEMNGGDIIKVVHAPLPFAGMAASDISGIKKFTRYQRGEVSVNYEDKTFTEGLAYSDSTFFEMFDIPIISGSHQSFKDLHTIFISNTIAEKYFGEENPIGKVLDISFRHKVEKQFIVGAVLEKIKANSSLPFEIMLRIEHFAEIQAIAKKPWEDIDLPAAFLEIESQEVVASIVPMFDKYKKIRNEAKQDQIIINYELVPFKSNLSHDVPVWSPLNRPMNPTPMVVFIILASMILLIACVNLTNTSIAMTSRRLKEIGLRKTLGASVNQVAHQFLLETLFIVLLSLIVGYLMSMIIVPEFSAMWNLPYGLEDMNEINLLIMLISVVIFTCILSGIYPAIFANRFKIAALLKGHAIVKGTNAITRILVIAQFSISVIVLIGGVVFTLNTTYQKQIKYGYNVDELLMLRVQNKNQVTAIIAEARSNPMIKTIGTTDNQIGLSTYQINAKFEGEFYEVRFLAAGENYVQTMGLSLLEGRSFDNKMISDKDEAVVVNEKFLKTVGLKGNPLGQYVEVNEERRKIIGVIDNFLENAYSSKESRPFVFVPAKLDRLRFMIFNVEKENRAEVKDFIAKVWDDNFPNKPFDSQNLEDMLIFHVAQTNDNLKKIFFFLTVLGGLMSASGIYSLASLNTAKRKKEIGIRKALGASVKNVVFLINREFVAILMVAGLVGSIGAFFGVTALLDEIYELHIAVEFLPTLLCVLVMFVIGAITTSVTIYRGALANPVDTLKED